MSKSRGLQRLNTLKQLLYKPSTNPQAYMEVSPGMLANTIRNLEDMMELWKANCIETDNMLTMDKQERADLLELSTKILDFLQKIKQNQLIHQLPLTEFEYEYEQFCKLVLTLK